jgi:hypothetical protein
MGSTRRRRLQLVAFAFFQGGSRPSKSTIAPLGEPGDGDIRLSGHQIQRLAAQQSPTIAILR